MRRFVRVALCLISMMMIMILMGCSTQPKNVSINKKLTNEELQKMITYEIPTDIKQNKENTTYGELITVEYPSSTVGNTRRANVLLPPNYDPKIAYPVLYLLHGIGGDENEWLFGNPKEIIGNLISAGEVSPMIVVIPNVRAREDDRANPSDIFTKEHFDAFDNFINDLTADLIPFMNENYNILQGREHTAIAGLSMGGRESLYIGLTEIERFGYIGAFSPAFGLLSYSNMNVNEEGLLKEEGFTFKPGYEDTYVMIVNGKQDNVVRDEPKKYHLALQNNNIDHIYYEIDGGHDFDVWSNGLYNFVRTIFN